MPDTVNYVVKQNIMLRVFFKNHKTPHKSLNLMEISICTTDG